MITFAAITPHPPIIVPGVGQKEDLQKVERTVLAMEKLGRELEKIRPDVILIISPHAPVNAYSFGINVQNKLEGDLSDFGLSQKFKFQNDPAIVDKLVYSCEMNNEIPIHSYESNLDHGMLVPLFYLTKNIKPLLVPISFSFLSLEMHYNFGELLGKICEEAGKDVAVIASGDLSHRLTLDAPAGFSPQGKVFDRELIKSLEKNDVKEILNIQEKMVNEAGECGLRSIVTLLGILKGRKYHFNEYSYEGPFGVGYLVARLL